MTAADHAPKEPTHRAGDVADPRAAAMSVASLAIGMTLASATPVLVAGASLEGLAVAVWRLWIPAVIFAAITLARRRQSWALLRLTARAGISFGGATALYFSALQLTSVANATLITVMQPLPLIVAARFMFSERIAAPDLGWIALALSGATVMVLSADSGGSADIGGDLIAAGATLVSAGYFIFGKRARATLDTDVFMTGLLFWAGLTIVPIALISRQDMIPPDGAEWVRMVALGFIVGFGHMLINFANGRLPLAVLGVFQLFVPVGAAIMAWAFLDQSITTGQGVGIAVVVVALTSHTRYSARMRAAGAT